MRRTMGGFVSMWVALTGCAGASVVPELPAEKKDAPPAAHFTALEASFQATPRGQSPLMILDDQELARAPAFKMVGVLQLTGKETHKLADFFEAAATAGAAAGCDVLYQRDAFELGTRVTRPRLPGSDIGGIGKFVASSGRDWHRTDELIWQFLCGVTATNGDEQMSSLKQATFLAVELRRKALGNFEPCEPYIPLGSHVVRRDVCANDMKHHDIASSSRVDSN